MRWASSSALSPVLVWRHVGCERFRVGVPVGSRAFVVPPDAIGDDTIVPHTTAPTRAPHPRVAAPPPRPTHTPDPKLSLDGRRPASWTPPLTDGTYSRLPAWSNRSRWLTQVAATLTTPDGETARAAARVAADTLLMVAAADAAVADQRTGRNVTTAHDTVATQLGMSAKTVQRARTLLERLGLAATVWAGRYLTRTERAAAHRRHGGPQLRAASTRALISPKRAAALLPVENVQLPRRGNHTRTTHPPKNSTTRVSARRKAASRTPIPVGVQKLAAQLARRMPWLTRDRHIGALARLLHRRQLDSDTGWTAERLLRVLEQHNHATGHLVPDPAYQRNPLGYLNARLTAATPHLAAVTPAAHRPRAEPNWRIEDAERRRRLATEDPAVAAAVIAQIRADIARDQGTTSGRPPGGERGQDRSRPTATLTQPVQVPTR